MNLCSDNHEEICYEGRHCPCCWIIEEKQQLESEITKLKSSIAELEQQIEENA